MEISTLRTELNQKAGDYLKIQTELDVLRDKYDSYQVSIDCLIIIISLYDFRAYLHRVSLLYDIYTWRNEEVLSLD